MADTTSYVKLLDVHLVRNQHNVSSVCASVRKSGVFSRAFVILRASSAVIRARRDSLGLAR